MENGEETRSPAADQPSGTIVVRFDAKPSAGTRLALRQDGFHWKGESRQWEASWTEQRERLARAFVGRPGVIVEGLRLEEPVREAEPAPRRPTQEQRKVIEEAAKKIDPTELLKELESYCAVRNYKPTFKVLQQLRAELVTSRDRKPR